MAEVEYLRFAPRDAEANLTFDELIGMGKVLAPAYLSEQIVEAMRYLEYAGGENQTKREMLAPLWFRFWTYQLDRALVREDLFDYKDRLIKNPGIVSLDKMAEKFANLRKKRFLDRREVREMRSGVLFMATGEGAPGHRDSWQQASNLVGLLGLLYEGEKYFADRPSRRKPYLTEAMRASMAVWFSKQNLVTRVPDKPDGVAEGEFYESIFDRTGAHINFVTRGDPHEHDKANRCILPELAMLEERITRHTSTYTQKLLADDQDFEVDAVILNNYWGGDAAYDSDYFGMGEDIYWGTGYER